MKNINNTYDYMKKIRNEWTINPRTRVQENELKNKKKRRQNEKKLVKEYVQMINLNEASMNSKDIGFQNFRKRFKRSGFIWRHKLEKMIIDTFT